MPSILDAIDKLEEQYGGGTRKQGRGILDAIDRMEQEYDQTQVAMPEVPAESPTEPRAGLERGGSAVQRALAIPSAPGTPTSQAEATPDRQSPFEPGIGDPTRSAHHPYVERPTGLENLSDEDKAIAAKGPKGLAESLATKGLDWLDYVPVAGGVKAGIEYTQLRDASEYLQSIQRGETPDPDKAKSDDYAAIRAGIVKKKTAQKIVDDAIMEYKEATLRGKTVPAQVADVVLQMIPYAAEIGLTGGAYKAAKVGLTAAGPVRKATQMLPRVLRGPARAVMGETAGALTRAATVGAPGIIADYQRKRTGVLSRDKDGNLVAFGQMEPVKAWYQAIAQSAIGYGSEESGKYINSALRWGGKIISPKLYARAEKALQRGLTGKAIRAGERLGFHGVAGEYGEERIDATLRALFKADDFGLAPEDNEGIEGMLNRLEKSIPTVEQSAVEIMAFMVPALARRGYAAALGAADRRAQRKVVGETLKDLRRAGAGDVADAVASVPDDQQVAALGELAEAAKSAVRDAEKTQKTDWFGDRQPAPAGLDDTDRPLTVQDQEGIRAFLSGKSDDELKQIAEADPTRKNFPNIRHKNARFWLVRAAQQVLWRREKEAKVQAPAADAGPTDLYTGEPVHSTRSGQVGLQRPAQEQEVSRDREAEGRLPRGLGEREESGRAVPEPVGGAEAASAGGVLQEPQGLTGEAAEIAELLSGSGFQATSADENGVTYMRPDGSQGVVTYDEYRAMRAGSAPAARPSPPPVSAGLEAPRPLPAPPAEAAPTVGLERQGQETETETPPAPQRVGLERPAPEPKTGLTREEKPEAKGRALFTSDELRRFDALNIDVSGVTDRYKSGALGQLEFQERKRAELASPDYDQNVRLEMWKQEARRAVQDADMAGLIRLGKMNGIADAEVMSFARLQNDLLNKVNAGQPVAFPSRSKALKFPGVATGAEQPPAGEKLFETETDKTKKRQARAAERAEWEKRFPEDAKMHGEAAQMRYSTLRARLLNSKTGKLLRQKALAELEEMVTTGDFAGQERMFDTPKPQRAEAPEQPEKIEQPKAAPASQERLFESKPENDLFKKTEAQKAEIERRERQAPEPETKTPEGDEPLADLSGKIAEALEKGTELTREDVGALAREAFAGKTTAEAGYTDKDIEEAVELGVNRMLLSEKWRRLLWSVREHSTDTAGRVMDLLGKIGVPKQVVRSLETQRYQQFSTPPPYAYAAAWVANIGENDVAMEPSAGLGGIAVMMTPHAKRVILNELSERRAKLLETLGIGPVTQENAEHLHAIRRQQKAERPTVVVMNPPFSQTAGRMGDKKVPLTGARHVEEALKELQDGGRLVAIVGRGMAMNAPTFRAWWKKIGSTYTVRANISVPGEVYSKYGTSFGTRLLVIDKTPPTTGTPLQGDVKSLGELLETLKGVRDAREPASAQSGVQDAIGAGGREARSDADVLSPTDAGSEREGPSEPSGRPGLHADAVGGEASRRGGSQRGDATGDRGEQRPGLEEVPESGAESAGEPEATGGSPVRSSRRLPPGETRTGDVSVEEEIAGIEGMTPETFDVVEKQDEAEQQRAIYEDYHPQSVKVDGAQPHPTPLVQTAAMAFIKPPPITYAAHLPKNLFTEGILSEAQAEPIYEAGQAHQTMLPDGQRQGYMCGDGTGSGKGRVIAGIILDNWNQGRKKAVWVSQNWELMNDAIRDWTDLDGESHHVFRPPKTKPEKSKIVRPKGICFITYDTLRAGMTPPSKGSDAEEPLTGRLKQLVDWLGQDFDGVIAFDEAHNMGNAVKVKGARGAKDASQKAMAGVQLQRALPKARIVYVTATAATEVSNLSYADRLGLWGPGTAFADRTTFIQEISDGGLAAMELVAKDLKAAGLYTARMLSFRGVEQRRLEHVLSPEQRQGYDTLTEAWQVALNNINEALQLTTANDQGKVDPKAKARAMSAFWGAHQRFFNQVLCSMQMPTVIAQMREALDAGESCVLQIVNTLEAQTERKLADLEDPDDIDNLDLTPKESLIDFVRVSFPTQQYEPGQDEDGNDVMKPVFGKDKKPVESPEAVAMRDALIDRLAGLRVVPDGPLEILINTFGVDAVAEITGRKRRVVRTAGGTVIEKRGEAATHKDVRSFLNDEKRILVFSQKGGTGASYHADQRFKNQRRRNHFLIQAGWRADVAVQGFGRTHRSNQVSAPVFWMASTDLPGHRRFISTIARRLDQLGALSKGERLAGTQGMYGELDNLENSHAKDAHVQFLEALAAGKIEGLDIHRYQEQTGLNLLDKKTGRLKKELPTIQQFLNRMLSLNIETQGRAFDAFMWRLRNIIEVHREAGTLDVGMEDLKADRIDLVGEQEVYKDKRTRSSTNHVELKLSRKTALTSFAVAKNAKGFAGFFVAPLSGKPYAIWDTGLTRTDAMGHVEPMVRVVTPTESRLHEKYSVGVARGDKKLSEDEAAAAWKTAIADAPKHKESTVHLITGAILPVWDRMKGKVKVRRAKITDTKRAVLGRVVDEEHIADTLKALGAEARSEHVTPGEYVRRIAEQGARATLANGWSVKRSRVNMEDRLEILGPEGKDQAELTRIGVDIQRRQYEYRYFIPLNTQAAGVFEKLTARRPVTTLSSGKAQFRPLPELQSAIDKAHESLRDANPQQRDTLSEAQVLEALAKSDPQAYREIAELQHPFHLGERVTYRGQSYKIAGAHRISNRFDLRDANGKAVWAVNAEDIDWGTREQAVADAEEQYKILRLRSVLPTRLAIAQRSPAERLKLRAQARALMQRLTGERNLDFGEVLDRFGRPQAGMSVDDVIRINEGRLTDDDIADTTLHEIVHHIERGFLTTDERALLDELQPDAEKRAEDILRYRKWKRWTEAKASWTMRARSIVMNMLRRLKRFVRGGGFRSVQEFYQQIMGGHFGKRGRIVEREGEPAPAYRPAQLGDLLGGAMRDAQRDPEKPKYLSTTGSNADVLQRARDAFMALPESVVAADGRKILIQNPDYNTREFPKALRGLDPLELRAIHVATFKTRISPDPDKVKWISMIPATLSQAHAKAYDAEYGTFLYARKYGDGAVHLVVVSRDGALLEQAGCAHGLVTQFGSVISGRRWKMEVVWKRDVNGGSRASSETFPPDSSGARTSSSGSHQQQKNTPRSGESQGPQFRPLPPHAAKDAERVVKAMQTPTLVKVIPKTVSQDLIARRDALKAAWDEMQDVSAEIKRRGITQDVPLEPDLMEERESLRKKLTEQPIGYGPHLDYYGEIRDFLEGQPVSVRRFFKKLDISERTGAATHTRAMDEVAAAHDLRHEKLLEVIRTAAGKQTRYVDMPTAILEQGGDEELLKRWQDADAALTQAREDVDQWLLRRPKNLRQAQQRAKDLDAIRSEAELAGRQAERQEVKETFETAYGEKAPSTPGKMFEKAEEAGAETVRTKFTKAFERLKGEPVENLPWTPYGYLKQAAGIGEKVGKAKGFRQTAEKAIDHMLRSLARDREKTPGRWVRMLYDINYDVESLESHLSKLPTDEARAAHAKLTLRTLFGKQWYDTIRKATNGDVFQTIEYLKVKLDSEMKRAYGKTAARLIGSVDDELLYNRPNSAEDYRTQWEEATRAFYVANARARALRDAKRFLNKMRNSGASPVDLDHQRQVIENRKAEVEKEVAALPWRTTAELCERLAEIRAGSDLAQTTQIEQRKMDNAERAALAVGELEDALPVLTEATEHGTPSHRGKVRGFSDKFDSMLNTIKTLTADKPNSVIRATLFDRLLDGNDAELQQNAEADIAHEEVMRKLGWTEDDLWKMERETRRKLPYIRQEAELSDMAIMELYALSRSPRTYMDILRNGVKAEKRRGMSQEGRDLIRGETPDQTEEIVQHLIAQLTPAQRDYVDAVMEIVASFSPKGNETGLKVKGYEPFLSEFYWPRRPDITDTARMTATEIEDGDSQQWRTRLLTQSGFLKKLVPHGHPFMLGSFRRTFQKHVDEMSRFTHLTIPTLDAYGLLNDPAVRTAMLERVGKDIPRELRHSVARVSGMESHASDWSDTNRKLSDLERRITTHIIAKRISSVIKNRIGGSILLCKVMSDHGVKYLATFLKHSAIPVFYPAGSRNATIRDALIKNGYFRDRLKMHVLRVMANLPIDPDRAWYMMRKQRRVVRAVQWMANAELNNAVNVVKTLMDHGYTMEAAIQEANRATRATQNPSTELERSRAYTWTKKTPLAGFLFPFFGQTTVQANLAMSEYQSWKYAKGKDIHIARKRLARTLAFILANILFNAALTAGLGWLMGGAWRDRKGNKRIANATIYAVSEAIDTLAPGFGQLAGLGARSVQAALRDSSTTDAFERVMSVLSRPEQVMSDNLLTDMAGKGLSGLRDTYTGFTDEELWKVERGLMSLYEFAGMVTGEPWLAGGQLQAARIASGVAGHPLGQKPEEGSGPRPPRPPRPPKPPRPSRPD